MKNLRIIYFLLLLVFCVSISPAAVKADYSEEQINLQTESFEKAYYTLKENWLFWSGHKTILKPAVERLSIFNVQSDPPVLGDNEKENLEAVKKYLRFLITENSNNIEGLTRIAIRGLIVSDYYSRLQSPKEARFNLLKNGSEGYIGDGLLIDLQNNEVIALITIPGTPAEKVFQPGDKILAINNVSFENVKTEKELDALIPEDRIGDKIIYRILRNNQELVLKTTIVKVGKSRWVSIDYQDQIGIIKIKGFGFGCGQHFIEVLGQLKNSNSKALILDLRRNPGGYLSQAKIVVKTITGQGLKIVSSQRKETILDNGNLKKIEFNGPIVVLVDDSTASAAEIVAASLQENGIMVFGERTYGKNFGQEVYLLPNKDYLWFSNLWAKTVGNRSWFDGIEPNVFVENDFLTRSDETLQEAIEFLKQKMEEKK